MRSFVKWTGIALGSILGLLIIAGAVLYVRGGSAFDGPDELPLESIAADPSLIDRGAHIAATHGCMDCHAARLEGQVLVDAPPFLVVASNLTSGAGGVGSRMDALGWERAIRHGVGVDGRGLAIMPSEMYAHMSDDDVAALIAWLDAQPPVDNELPPTEIRPLGRIIAGMGGLAPTSQLVNHTEPHLDVAPPMAATVEYGAYRARTLCHACHGPNLEGAQPPNPDSPWAPSLHGVKGWTLEQFVTTLRTGQTPARQLDSLYMPYNITRELEDVEIEALHLYIKSLPQPSGTPVAAR